MRQAVDLGGHLDKVNSVVMNNRPESQCCLNALNNYIDREDVTLTGPRSWIPVKRPNNWP